MVWPSPVCLLKVQCVLANITGVQCVLAIISVFTESSVCNVDHVVCVCEWASRLIVLFVIAWCSVCFVPYLHGLKYMHVAEYSVCFVFVVYSGCSVRFVYNVFCACFVFIGCCFLCTRGAL